MPFVLLPLYAACVSRGDVPGDAPEPDSAPPVEGALTERGVVTCADPAAREDAPLVRLVGSTAWDDQVPGTLEATTGWGLVVADLDGDSFLDVFLPQHGDARLLLGQGDGSFRVAEGAVPASDGTPATGASAADHDGDGDLDLYVARHGPDLLLVNDGGGRFTDGTTAAGLDGFAWDSIGGAWGDMDADGDLDLFVSTWATRSNPPSPDDTDADPNQLWENDGAGGFVDRSDRLAPFHTAAMGWTYAAGWWDVDGVNGPDLYITSDKGHGGYTGTLLRNGGDGQLTDASEGSGLDLAIQAMGLGVADLNDDRVPDFFVTDWGAVWLLVSDGNGSWYDASLARGMDIDGLNDRVVGWGAELVDVDNDGDDDAVATFGPDDLAGPTYNEYGLVSLPEQPDGLWLQDDDGGFTQRAEAWGFDDRGVGRGFVAADLDGNGWLDFVRRDILGVARVDLQRCGAEGWLTVALGGPAPNTRGIGARVEVEAGDRRWIRWIQSGSTNLASSPPPEAHFGLGDHDTVDTLTVFWPDGATQVFTDIDARQRVTITR